MPTETGIAWTDFSSAVQPCPGQHVPVPKLVGGLSASRLRPLEDITRALGAIARCAGRHDVARRRPPSKRNRDDVVPRGRSIRAIGAQSLEVIKQHALCFDQDRGNTTLTAPDLLSDLQARRFILSIPSPLFRRDVRQTPAATNISGRQPTLTPLAPTFAGLKSSASLHKRRTWPLPRQAARHTRGRQAIHTRSINGEVRLSLPVLPLGAPLLTSGNAPLVLVRRDAHVLGCTLDRALTSLCHACPLAFSVHPIIPGGCRAY